MANRLAVAIMSLLEDKRCQSRVRTGTRSTWILPYYCCLLCVYLSEQYRASRGKCGTPYINMLDSPFPSQSCQQHQLALLVYMGSCSTSRTIAATSTKGSFFIIKPEMVASYFVHCCFSPGRTSFCAGAPHKFLIYTDIVDRNSEEGISMRKQSVLLPRY